MSLLGIMRNEFDMIDLPGTAIFLFALLFVYVLVHVCLLSKIFIVSFYHKKQMLVRSHAKHVVMQNNNRRFSRARDKYRRVRYKCCPRIDIIAYRRLEKTGTCLSRPRDKHPLNINCLSPPRDKQAPVYPPPEINRHLFITAPR